MYGVGSVPRMYRRSFVRSARTMPKRLRNSSASSRLGDCRRPKARSATLTTGMLLLLREYSTGIIMRARGDIIVAVRTIRWLLAALLAAAALGAAAQEPESRPNFPSRSIRLVIDTSPGGVTDLFGRLMAEALAQKIGQTVFVDNKPGASGNLAIEFLVRSPPDGYTLMIASGGGL